MGEGEDQSHGACTRWVANWGSAVLVATGTGTGTEWTGQPVPVCERVLDSFNLIGYIKSLVREYYPLRHHTADRPSSGNPPFLTPFFFFLSQSHMISFLFGHNSKKMSPQSHWQSQSYPTKRSSFRGAIPYPLSFTGRVGGLALPWGASLNFV